MRACFVALVAFAVACQRSSGGDSRRVYPQEGIRQGSMVAPGSGATTNATLIVEPGGLAYLVPLDADGKPLYDCEFWGRLFADAGVVTGSLDHFDSYGSVTLDVAGAVAPRATLQFDLHDGAVPPSLYDAFHVDVSFDATYDRDASLARVAGDWSIGATTLAVAIDGSIVGGDPDGDRFYGSLRPGIADVDLYWIEIEAYLVGDHEPWYFQGVAIAFDRGTTDGALLFTTHGSQYGWLGETAYWSGLLTR